MTVTMTPKNKTTVRFRFKNRTVTAEQLLELLERNPKAVEAQISEGVQMLAAPAVLDALHTSSLGELIDDDGEVTTSAFGAAAVVGALLVGFAIGFAVGYVVGSEGDAADEPATDSGDSGDSGDWARATRATRATRAIPATRATRATRVVAAADASGQRGLVRRVHRDGPARA